MARRSPSRRRHRSLDVFEWNKPVRALSMLQEANMPKFLRKKADINITPLIDVLLVLLVIFMVITPLTPQGLETSVPQPAPLGPKQQLREETLVLSLSRDGDIRLNKEDLDSTSVSSRLSDVFRTRADRTLFVQADDEVLYNDVAQLIDVAKGAGATRIGLMTEKIKGNL
jgi:biopolymer transport protein TolR